MMKTNSLILWLSYLYIFCVVAQDVEDFAEDIYEEEFGKIVHASVVSKYFK